MRLVEQAAQELLIARGVDVRHLGINDDLEDPTAWDLALVADNDGDVVGMARLTELTPDLLVLDQVSVLPKFASHGLGRLLLMRVVDEARKRGYREITGSTFREVAFNAPFYASLGASEDPEPHPALVQRRHVESELGLDHLGPRVIMRVTL